MYRCALWLALLTISLGSTGCIFPGHHHGHRHHKHRHPRITRSHVGPVHPSPAAFFLDAALCIAFGD